jgi:phosphoglycerol transferase MdoB-like AlkP superfamily enzyme
MDTVLLSYIILPLFLILILLPTKLVRMLRSLFSLYFAFFLSLFIFMELATFSFLAEFDTRPDRLFFEHIVQVKEVFTMVWRGYFVELCLGIPLTFFCAIFVYKLFQNIFIHYPPVSIIKRIILLIIIVPLLTIGGRSSIGHRPANISTAAFSQSHLVNQLGLNSTYSLIYAYYRSKKHEKDPRKINGRMDEKKMFDEVFASAGISKHSIVNPEKNLFHYQESNFPREQPLNLVIILEESLGAEYVGFLGGLPLTPNIDKLSEEGVSFTNLYSTGTRTVRGIEAIICGFLPTKVAIILLFL